MAGHPLSKTTTIFPLTISFLAVWAFVGVAVQAQTLSTDRLNQIPDVMQVDPRAGFKRFGKEYCGPAAVSNSLIWLAHNGFPNLIRYTGNDVEDQFEVVRTLASPDYMGTDDKFGSTPNQLLQGVKKYVQERGYKIKKLGYQGKDKVLQEFQLGSLPDLTELRDNFSGPSALWIELGYYADDKRGGYDRSGGHWVTLVGFGIDEKGQADPDILIIHDPGNVGHGHQYLHMTKCNQGALRSKAGEVPADGFRQVLSGVSPNCDACFMEGYAVLTLEQ